MMKSDEASAVYTNPVFTVQPGTEPPPSSDQMPGKWMPMSPTITNCPPGLEYLTMIDRLVVKQKVSTLEMLVGVEVANKYVVSNGVGQQAYFALEESDCLERQCCGPYRSYTIHIVDNFQKEVIRIRRPFKCCTAPCFADSNDCGSETTIESPPGNVIGIVRERYGCLSRNFVVRDASDSVDYFRIEGPNMCSWNFQCNCCADKVFQIVTPNGDQSIGAIRKKWRGCGIETVTDADTFSVEFPLNLDVKLKAALLGATFLIDFLVFEKTTDQKGLIC